MLIRPLTLLLPALTSGNGVGSVSTNVGLLVTFNVKEVVSAGGVEPAWDPAPLLAVPEELACAGEQAALGARHRRVADAFPQ